MCDFDGTLALQDVGDELCARFAHPSWKQAEADWHEGRLTIAEAQRIMWSTVFASGDELEDAARELCTLRPGADALFDAAARALPSKSNDADSSAESTDDKAALRLVIASAGFENYIRAILGTHLEHVAALYANKLICSERGASCEFPFEHTDLAAHPYALCKAKVCTAENAQFFCGDGSSDKSVVSLGEHVMIFAVRGSLLARHCASLGRDFYPFDSFDEVLEVITAKASVG